MQYLRGRETANERGKKMKTSSELRAEIAELTLARSLARLGGNVEMARAANDALIPLVTELDRRATVNREQVKLYKKGA